MSDNDPFEPLDNFPEGLHVNALPASEVRRRGDRMRRRNTALAAVGGVVAAAVFIGVPVALMSGDDKDTVEPAPQPTPTVTEDPQPGWITDIPQDFPLTAGMVTGDGTVFEGDLDAFPLCEMAYPTSPGTAATRTVSFSDDGESSVTRTFQLWPDDVTADASLDELVAGVQACPRQASLGGEDVVETKLVDYANGGDRMVAFAQQYAGDDGLLSQLTTVQVTRVGNAVLVNSTYGSAGGDKAIEVATQILDEGSETTRGAMCVFSADPCSASDSPSPITETSEPPPASGTGAAIPADFPIAQGMDAAGATDVATGPPFDVCGTPAWQPSGVVERLAVRGSDIEYLEERELVTFITADEPADSLTQVRDAVSACPRIQGVEDESSANTTRILQGPEGLDSFTWGYFADEGLGGGVYQLTRVGSAVLVLYVEGEMSESSLQPTADDLTETTLAIVPEMCIFTEDGCA